MNKNALYTLILVKRGGKEGTQMRLTFLFLALYTILTLGCSKHSMITIDPLELEKIVSKAKNSKIILLDVYHDRCESCKLIEPIMEKLKEQYAGTQEVAFLKYDLSNPITIFKSRQVAKELGLDDIYKKQRYSGIVLFIDSKNNEIIESLIAEYDIKKYTELIENNLKT